MNNTRLVSGMHASALAAALVLSAPASGGIGLPGGDTTLDGSFANLTYGPTAGGTAYLSPLLFVSQFAQTLPPPAQVLGTDLSFGYTPLGLGSSTFGIDYRITNNSAADTFTDLRFIVNVEPSGSQSFMDTVTESWGAKAAGDPDARQVASYDPGNPLLNRAQSNNGLLDATNECGAAACDADLALQWNRAQLSPGESWTVRVTLSDDPATPGTSRFLRAVSVDDPATMLTVSAVPEPSTYVLFSAGLGVLLWRARRTRSERA